MFRLFSGSLQSAVDVVVSAFALALTLTYLAPAPINVQQRTGARLFAPDPPYFATLGPEAPSILNVLVSAPRVIPIQPGELPSVASQHPISALVLPEDWADDADQKFAHAQGIAVVTLRRHNRIANLLTNIETLGALANQRQAAREWQDSLRAHLRQIERTVRHYSPVRVLVLSPEGYTQGQDTLITELLVTAGGINVAASAGIPEARQVEDAQIRALAPDVVLLTGWDHAASSDFMRNPLYRGISAFERSRIYQLDRLTALGKDPSRLITDIQHLVELLHPMVF